MICDQNFYKKHYPERYYTRAVKIGSDQRRASLIDRSVARILEAIGDAEATTVQELMTATGQGRNWVLTYIKELPSEYTCDMEFYRGFNQRVVRRTE